MGKPLIIKEKVEYRIQKFDCRVGDWGGVLSAIRDEADAIKRMRAMRSKYPNGLYRIIRLAETRELVWPLPGDSLQSP